VSVGAAPRTWVDYFARIGSLLGLSFPAFVSATPLLAFAIGSVIAGSLDGR
jgi:ABC-type dipeptide/oligopeptide/nickel transport system permease component